MKEYNLDKLLSSYIDNNISEDITVDDYQPFLENFVSITKPDFVSVFNPNIKKQLIYTKNYNLKFPKEKEESIYEIIKAVDVDQIEIITEVDNRCLKFVKKNSLAMELSVFKLRFTASLIKGSPKSYIRTILFIPHKHNKLARNFFIVAFNDVTSMLGVNKDVNVDIRCECDTNKKFERKLNQLKKDIKNILKPEIEITPREKSVLKLISLGKTSKEIANKLFISVATVNTHRQNLIRKFNVKNTAALIRMIE